MTKAINKRAVVLELRGGNERLTKRYEDSKPELEHREMLDIKRRWQEDESYMSVECEEVLSPVAIERCVCIVSFYCSRVVDNGSFEVFCLERIIPALFFSLCPRLSQLRGFYGFLDFRLFFKSPHDGILQ
jgi:hypothetical protein